MLLTAVLPLPHRRLARLELMLHYCCTESSLEVQKQKPQVDVIRLPFELPFLYLPFFSPVAGGVQPGGAEAEAAGGSHQAALWRRQGPHPTGNQRAV